MQFTDIHCHLLPGMDDGPATLEETAQMLLLAYQAGTRRIVATPHMFHKSFQIKDIEDVCRRYAETCAQLKQLAGQSPHSHLSRIEILLGAENYANIEFIDALENGRVLTLNGSPFLLIEFPLDTRLNPFSMMMRRIRGKGYTPVLAHAERYRFVQQDPLLLADFLEKGGLVQVNADSFLGGLLSRARRTSNALLKKNLISVIASDGHRANARQPDLGPAWKHLSGKFPPEQIRPLMSDNPGWLVDAVREAQ